MKLLRFSTFVIVSNLISYAGFTQLTSTNLPIVIIATPTTISTTQIQGTISIIDNVSGVNTPTDAPKFTGMIGVNVRGNTTYPKSSYTVETWSSPTVSLDTILLGMPSDNDWVLLAIYEDRSLLRNTLSFHLHEQMGRYTSRQRYCEVLVNSQYMGIYTFGEKIKRDSLRLDIAKLNPTDNSGNELTGGYIVKIDGGGAGWISAFTPPYAGAQQIKFEYEYPSAGDITPAQEDYIESYVDSFETELNGANFQDTVLGWRRHGAENSFMDFMIMQEVSRNHEAYRKNTFLYKDKGTKLRPGPLWSMDAAWKNTMDCNSSKDTGWCYNFGAACGTDNKLPPFWWQKLSTDASFMEELKCRYTDYRKPGHVLDTTKVFAYMDSVKLLLNASSAVTRNFTQWPIWGVPLNNEPTPMATNYTEELKNMKLFIKSRLAWLDTKWISTSPGCLPLSTKDVLFEQSVSIYPNPSSDQLTIQIEGKVSGGEQYQISLLTIQGRIIHSLQTKNTSSQLDVSSLSNGVYMLTVSSSTGKFTGKFIKN